MKRKQAATTASTNGPWSGPDVVQPDSNRLTGEHPSSPPDVARYLAAQRLSPTSSANLELERRIYGIRWLGIVLCCVAAPFFGLKGPNLVLVYAVLAVAGACNWMFGRLVDSGRAVDSGRSEMLFKAYAYGAFDIAMGTAIVAVTGGAGSPFVLGYFPVVAHASVRFGRQVALLSSAAAALGYLVAGYIVSGNTAPPIAQALLTIGLITMTAIFAGLLSDRAHAAELALARQLDRARTAELALAQQLERARELNVATAALPGSLEWSTVVRGIARQGRVLVGADVAILQLRPATGQPEDTDPLLLPKEEWVTDALPGGAYLAKLVLQGNLLSHLRAPEQTDGVTIGALGRDGDGLPPAALLRIPISARGQWVGDLLLLRASPEPSFSESDANIARAFGNQAALALENARLYEHAKEQATTDAITGLPNHRALKEYLDAELARAHRRKRSLCVLMLDIDHFKQYNDAFGHAAGDLALRTVASTLRSALRRGDYAARYAGEEFVAILPEAEAQTGVALGERVRQAIAAIHEENTTSLPGRLTASVGIAAYPEHGTNADELLRAADHSMYLAKHGGRNQVRTAGELGTLRGLEALFAQQLNHLSMPSSRLGPHLIANLEARFAQLASLQQEGTDPTTVNLRPDEEVGYRHTVQAVTALAAAIDAKDHYTEGHSRSVSLLGTMLARAAGCSPDMVEAVRVGGLLHDIGKIAIPEETLNKKGPLDEAEWIMMRTHVGAGVRILSPIAALDMALPIVMHHHERWDGSGYPSGLRGEEIPLGARIIAICDAYNTIISDRPYRRGRSHREALRRLFSDSGSHFDATLVRLFADLPLEGSDTLTGGSGPDADDAPVPARTADDVSVAS